MFLSKHRTIRLTGNKALFIQQDGGIEMAALTLESRQLFQASLAVHTKLCREGLSEPNTTDFQDGAQGSSLNQSFHHVFLVYNPLFWLPDRALTAF